MAAGQVCAIDAPSYSAGNCAGDSGGPLLVREADGAFVELGLVQGSVGRCETDRPDVFTAANLIAGWAQGQIGQFDPG
jgi:secreted trypsin-like serine protease